MTTVVTTFSQQPVGPGWPKRKPSTLQLLGDFRGYQQDRDFFAGFPQDVVWWRATTGREELARVRYINDSCWVALSGGSRLPPRPQRIAAPAWNSSAKARLGFFPWLNR